MSKNELFNSSQHGFQNGRSCLSQLLAHYNRITKLLLFYSDNGDTIPEKNSLRDLGVTMSNDASFSQHTSKKSNPQHRSQVRF